MKVCTDNQIAVLITTSQGVFLLYPNCTLDTCRPFQELLSPVVEVFLTPDRGWGVKAAQPIQHSSFIVELVGGCIAAQ